MSKFKVTFKEGGESIVRDFRYLFEHATWKSIEPFVPLLGEPNECTNLITHKFPDADGYPSVLSTNKKTRVFRLYREDSPFTPALSVAMQAELIQIMQANVKAFAEGQS